MNRAPVRLRIAEQGGLPAAGSARSRRGGAENENRAAQRLCAGSRDADIAWRQAYSTCERSLKRSGYTSSRAARTIMGKARASSCEEIGSWRPRRKTDRRWIAAIAAASCVFAAHNTARAHVLQPPRRRPLRTSLRRRHRSELDSVASERQGLGYRLRSPEFCDRGLVGWISRV